MKILVSACLWGVKCKYNGEDNKNEAVIKYCQDKEVILVCPEVEGGMPSPRTPVEIVDGRVTDKNGKDVDTVYRDGVCNVMKRIAKEDISLAILKSRSPTCGVHEIYDGTFSGVRIKGQGILTKALVNHGISVIDEEEIGTQEKGI